MTDDLLDYATEFQFLVFPEGHPDGDLDHEAVTVVWRGDDRWAVKIRSGYIDAAGITVAESIPAGRADEFEARFRFSRDEAVRIAREVGVPKERARWEDLIARRKEADRGSGR